MPLPYAASPIRSDCTTLGRRLGQPCSDRLRTLHLAFRTQVLAILLVTLCSAGYSQYDPSTLQKQSIQRLDAFVENFRKTGDFQSLLPQLQEAEAELLVSYKGF